MYILSLAFLFIALIRSVIYSIKNVKIIYFGIFFPSLARKIFFPRFFFKFFLKRAKFSSIPAVTKQTGKWNTRPRLFETYSRCTPALNLTPRIHAPVLSPLIRNGLHESTTSSLAFLLRSPSISHYFILERRTFRRKMR